MYREVSPFRTGHMNFLRSFFRLPKPKPITPEVLRALGWTHVNSRMFNKMVNGKLVYITGINTDWTLQVFNLENLEDLKVFGL